MRYILLCLCLALTSCSTAMVDEIFGSRYDRIEYRDKVIITWIGTIPRQCGKLTNVEGCASVTQPLSDIAIKHASKKTCTIKQKNNVEHIDRIDWIELAQTMIDCFDGVKHHYWDSAVVTWNDSPNVQKGNPRFCIIQVPVADLNYLTLAEETLHCFGWDHQKGYELQWRPKTLKEDRKDWLEKEHEKLLQKP